jgi:glutamate-1-semialdehyde aminotransferase
MPKDRDEASGKYTEAYPREEFLDALRALGGSAGTQEIADEVGCAYRTAHSKLTTLEQDEVITSRHVGNAKLWQVDSPDS